jgi:hypothetical protein
LGCRTVGLNSRVAAGWDPGGSSDRSSGRLKARSCVVADAAVGCRSHCHIAVAVSSCLPQGLGGCSQSRVAVLDDHVGIVGRPVRWCHSTTGHGRGFGRCRKQAVNNLVEASGHRTLADLEMSTGRIVAAADHIEVAADHIEVAAGHIEAAVGRIAVAAGRVKAVAADSNLGLQLGCSHSCYLQPCGLGADIGSWWLEGTENSDVVLCREKCKNVEKPLEGLRYTHHQRSCLQHVSS